MSVRNLIEAIWPTDGSITSLLDLGCGDLWFTAGLPAVTQHIGIDMFEPYLEAARAKNVPGFVAYNMDLREYIRLKASASIDAVVAIDVVEHFDEERAKSIISQMERVARRLVIVWTTLGWIEQGEYDNNGVFNPLQKHLSAPTVEWFPTTNGWKVDIYPEWHGPRGGAIFAYKWIKKQVEENPYDKLLG